MEFKQQQDEIKYELTRHTRKDLTVEKILLCVKMNIGTQQQVHF